MKLFVPCIAPSTNAMYSGQHWTKRAAHKKEMFFAVCSALFELDGRHLISPPTFINPVKISVQPMLSKSKRAYDVSNYSYTYKLIEDVLVKRKILKDDTPATVRSVVFLSPKKGAKSGIEITIEDCE